MLNPWLYKKVIPSIISLALFMEALDTTIINTAIPAMAKSLGVNPVDLKIALISYLLSLAVFIPISGWIADKFGVKKVFTFALIVFTLSSVWCGFSQTIWELIFARTLQGLGGSLTMPVGRLILARLFERHEFINNMGRIVMMAALGAMLGPVLGGTLTHYLSWHWIFWVNIPVGLLAIISTQLWMKESEKQEVLPLDKFGFLLFGSGLATLTFSLSALSESSIPKETTLLILLISGMLLTGYLVHSKQVKNPIVKTQLFEVRTFQISILGNLFSRLGFGGFPFLFPLLLQIGLGYNPQTAGLLIAPTAIGVLTIKLFAIRALKAFGYKRLLIINTIIVSFFLFSFTFINQSTPFYWIVMLTFMYGFAMSLQYSAMNSLAYADVAKTNLSSATSIMSTIQQLAQSFWCGSERFLDSCIFSKFSIICSHFS